MPAVTISASNLVPVTVAAGQPATQLITVTPGVTPTLDPTVLPTLITAVTDTQKATQPSSLTTKTPANFTVTDESSAITTPTPTTVSGEAFSGATIGPKLQFVAPTTDYDVTAAVPNVMIKTGTGDDVIILKDGRNIVSAGSGQNQITAGGGKDIFIADATKVSGQNTITNFKSGDDAVMLGLSTKDFTMLVSGDTNNGKGVVDVLGTTTTTRAAEIVVDGFTNADIGTKLIIGQSALPDGTPFVFLHAV